MESNVKPTHLKSQQIVNNNQIHFDGFDPPGIDPVWTRVDVDLARRKMQRQHPSNWSQLARSIGVSIQAAVNWHKRGIPAHAHADLARALEWSVDKLLGIEPAKAAVKEALIPPSEHPAVLSAIARQIAATDEPTRTRMIEAILQASTRTQASGRRLREIGPPPGMHDRRH